MKLWKKALSLALCLCLVLSLMPALAPVEAEAASVPTYISGIYFAANKNQSTAKNAVKNAGYTLIDYDLNKGCGAASKYIYMGYKTTSDPSQAITGIFFSDDIKNPAASYTFPYNGKQITANKVSDVDLNSGASGDYIFAYTTTDLNFGNPVTTIQIKGNNSINAAEADGTWTIGRQIASGALYGTDGRNLNAATIGDKIYLHYKQAKALEAKAYFYQMGAQDAVSTVCTSYSGTVYDNYNTIEAKPQILQEASLGGVTYRFAGWREDTNGYVVTTTKPQMGADKVRYYYAIYDFDITVTFDSDGGNGAPDSFTVTSRAGAWQGTIPPGSTLPFFPISQEGVTVTLPTTVPTKEGTCGFRRWVRICDGTTVEPGGKILMTFARYYSQMRAEYLSHGDSNGDGFCDRCDTPIDKPSVSNGAYQISTKAQLAWFMQKVNKGETSANAVLVNDIDMGGYEWTPITSTGLYYKTEGSDKGYAGTFDGAGYTISNFKITASTTEEKTYGLFGTLSGTVKNLGIRNVTYNFPNGIKDLRAAGIVGQMLPGSTVTDCFVVDSSIAPGKYIVGGVAACNYGGTIANCYTKNVTVKGDDRCGNLVSDTRGDNSETDRRGTVINCYTDASRVTGTQTGNLTSNCEAGVTADRFASGEIAYRLGQAWGQTLGQDLLPTPGKAQVYYGYTTCHRDQTAPIYTNQQTTAEKPGHSFNENYICTVCELVCTHTEFAGGTCLCGKITGGYCGAEGDGKNLTWTLVDGVLTITGTGASAEYTVYTDVPWQQYSGDIKSVVIEEGVTGTANYAFALCEQLTQVQLPSSMETLGLSTFYGCNQLESVIIPQKVTVIPEYAFWECENLKSITFKGKITTIGAHAFRECVALTKITLPDTVVSIGIQAFRGVSRLEEIVIPDSTTSIGETAFRGCFALKTVTIGNGVTQIGDNAFKNCETLKTLIWLAEGDVALGVDVFSGTTNTANVDLLMTYHHADEITDLVNWNGYTFKSIRVLCADGTLNHTTDYTGNNDLSHHIACSTCGYVGDEVHAYGENGTCDICSYTCTHTTFAGGTCICGKITGGYCGADEDGKNLTWTLIDGVLTISGNGAMKDYNDEDPSWHGMYDQIQAIVIEDGVTTIGNYALSLCKEVVEVEIPDSVTSIGIGAFGLCNSLEKITIPSQVTVISEMAFFQCDALNTVIFNGNVTTIGKEAFYDCLQLTNIVFPDSLQTIEEYAFYQCIKLTEIVIPDHVTSIGENAFSTCLALTSLTIGKSVTQIGNRAFVDCTALETLIWLAEGDVALGVDVFSGTTNTANVDLLLTYHHADEITDLVNWNGFTFKSIRVLCADGTLNHTTDYTDNTDGTHGINCTTCGYVGDEVHAYGENGTCDICSYTCTHTTFAGGTCICGKITGGYCGADEDGKNLIWTLVDGLLTISGEGAMKDYDVNTDPAPWYEIREQIQSIVIEDGVTTIGTHAFTYCTAVTEVEIPDSVMSIADGAFGRCELLEQITLPEKVTVISDRVFLGCENLNKVTFKGNITSIGERAFEKCIQLRDISLPDTLESIGERAFFQCKLAEIIIPDNVETIAYAMFAGCSELKRVTIGKGIAQIEAQAFVQCNALEELIWLAEGDVIIGTDVFVDTENNSYTANIDLLLTYHHAEEITDLVNWKGFTFKSIRVLCADGTLNHTADYTANTDGTHGINCTTCGYVGNEVHAPQYAPKDNATHEMTCTLCGYAATEACSGVEGTATCINRKVCDLCQAPYGELNPNNHAAETYTNGFLDCCGKVYEPATGSGTESDPYKIGNAGQLYWFADQVNSGSASAWAELTADIVVNENVLNADGTLNEGTYRTWTPIGTSISTNYSGTFDGKSYTVSGLYFNDSTVDYVGLFGFVSGGTVQNVGVVDSYLSGNSDVGGVAGYIYGTVTNCYNTGTVSGSYGVGGVVGYNNYYVTNCYNTGTVSGSDYVGGVVGWNYHSTVTNCYNTGTVSGDRRVGGVVGWNTGTVTGCYNNGTVSGSNDGGGVVAWNGGTVTGCYNTGVVSGRNIAGGVVDNNIYGGTVIGCYNTGTVSGSSRVGGVVGLNDSDSTVTNCYNSGTVSGNIVGGVVGSNNSTVTNCYYDSTVFNGDSVGKNNGSTVTDVMGKTTEQFASGEVAYLLSLGCTVGEGEDAVTYPGDIWGQNIDGEGDKDAYPVFSDAKVYQILNCNNEPAGYSNTDSDALGHDWTDADCDTPKTCTGCGTTEGDALGHDWDGNVCVRCDMAAQARIADTHFINFTDAVAAAKEGDIIQVLTDVAIDEELTFAGFVTLQVADGVRITPDKTMVKIGTAEGMIFDNKLYFYKETDERGISLAKVTKPTYYKAGDGYAIYLPATDSTEAILELHNATITTRDHELDGSSNSSKAIEWNGDLTLRFFGTNTIAAGQCQDTNRGIIVGGNLTLEGSEDAVLYVSSGKCPTASIGIVTNNLIITGGTVYVSARESDCQSIAVSAETVTVAEGAALYAAGGITPDLSIGVVSMNVSGNINALVLTMTIISDDEIVWDVIAMGDAQLTANTQLVYHAKDIGYEPKITFTVPENAVLTVNEGVTLNLVEPALESIDFSGTVVNNGTILLPADFRLEDAPKGGNVSIGEKSFTWNGHMWICTGDNHSWLDATCTDPKSCKYCSATEGEALGHKLVDRICTVCNKMPLRIEMTNIDATGWNGNAIRVCEDGQLVATVTLAEDKTGDIWYYLGDPNKTYEFYWVKGDYCGGCGFAITIGDETVMIAFADVNMEYADGIRIYPACEEHDYQLVKVHEPTCDLWGYTLYVCAVCGESKEDDYVPSLGHTIAEDAVGVVTPPTCENDGYTTYECDRCGESFNTLYVPALPHTLGEDGLCSVCGQPYTVPVWVAGIQIDANNLTDVLGDGTVSYDPSANVLTLNGFAYEGTDAGIYTTMSVNIVLLGENTIHTEYYSILSEAADGELTISGTGTLTINSDTVGIEMYHYGQASLVIGGSVTVSAYAEDAEGIACYSETGEASVVLQDHAKVILGTQEAPLGEECVYVDGFTCGSFTIEENASISGITTDEEGIYVTGDQQFIVISDNASVYVCADDEALDANTIRISGGTVTAIGGEGYEGIYADELTITGGTVTVSTVEVEDRAGDGVEADCITITGGTLKILSGGLIASMDGGETNVPGTITLGEGVVITSPAGAVLGQFDLTAIGEGMVLAVLDAEGNFADSLIIQFCVHEWADADCDTPKTCEICGATEGEALGHSFENGSCSVCGEPDPDYVDNKPVITLKYPTLSFKDEVLINIYFDVSNLDNVEEMGLILYDTQVETWNIHNARKVISGYRYSQSNGLYAVTTDGIPAKNLTDTVWFAIYAKLADGSYTYTKLADYSPKMYADSLLGTGDAKLDGLLVSMLNYGAAAQLYFGYKTDDLVNKDLTAEQKALVSGYRSDMVTTSVSVPAEKQGGFLKNVTKIECCPSVSFKGAFAINYYYKPETAPADGITLYYWDEEAYASNEVLTAQNAVGTVEMTLTADGKYTASVKGIPARKVNAEVYVALSYSDGTTTYNSGILPYSIGEYCSSFANTDHEFAPMAEATAVYGYYAKQYFS